MIVEFCGRSAHHTKSLSEMIVVARQSSGKEMTQPVLNCETCVELRDTGFDETAILTGARFKPLSEMLTHSVRANEE